MADTKWTDELVAELKRLHEAGYSAAQIAKEMRLGSRNAVIGKLHRLGLGRIAPSRLSKPKRVRPTPREPKPPRRPAEPLPRVPILERKCQWPVGDPREPGFHFCLEPCEKTYCEEHRKLGTVRSER